MTEPKPWPCFNAISMGCIHLKARDVTAAAPQMSPSDVPKVPETWWNQETTELQAPLLHGIGEAAGLPSVLASHTVALQATDS